MERKSKDALISELKTAGARVRGTVIKCPFHEDKTPSGGVYQDSNGVWRFKCHAAGCGFCGDIFDVRAKITGQPLDKVLRESNPNPTKTSHTIAFESIEAIESTVRGSIEARHRYTNPDTNQPDLIILRIKDSGKKRFLQISPHGNGFVMKAPPKPWPIYNRIELQTAETVICVEGEKCVHSLRKARLAGTTSPCGAGKAQYADWIPLAGKTVYLWPDNDKGGIEHMKDVAGILDKLEPVPTVFWINPIDLKLPAGGDVVDFLAKFEADLHHSAVQSVLENAEPIGASKEVQVLIEDTIAGRREAIDWPFPVISKLTRALLPKTVTLICGDPGAAKSFFLLQAMAYWFDKGIKVAVFELEEDRAYHLTRALAQQADKGDLFDPDWIKSNPKDAMSIFNEHKDFLDGLGRCIYAATEKQAILSDLAEWVEARAKDGCRVIAIDPVTAAASIKETWVADSAFMFRVKAIAREYGASIVLVTHPRKGRKTAIGLDELAGGAAYQRFSQAVIWLERHKQPKDVTVASPVGRSSCEINWTAHLIKTRNGAGSGLGIGLNFFGESLKFGEQGVIIPEKKE
ncbi:MAG: AAA family ATPase [Planctomycetota bacterium]|jgi:KaiC/GvpD/RAD55 family RecA-like ATPase